MYRRVAPTSSPSSARASSRALACRGDGPSRATPEGSEWLDERIRGLVRQLVPFKEVERLWGMPMHGLSDMVTDELLAAMSKVLTFCRCCAFEAAENKRRMKGIDVLLGRRGSRWQTMAKKRSLCGKR